MLISCISQIPSILIYYIENIYFFFKIETFSYKVLVQIEFIPQKVLIEFDLPERIAQEKKME